MIPPRKTALIACVLLPACVSRPPLLVDVSRDGEEGCIVRVDQRQLGSEELLEYARTRRGGKAIVRADQDSPWRCIGGAIFTLQRSGLRILDVTVDGASIRHE